MEGNLRGNASAQLQQEKFAVPPPQTQTHRLPLSLTRWKKLKLRCKSKFQIRQLVDSPAISIVVGLVFLLASRLPVSLKRRQSLVVLATRRLESETLQKLGRWALSPWLEEKKADSWRQNQIGWARYTGSFADIRKNPELTTSLLLKNPGPHGEKGVIYSSFEFNWMKIVANHDARRLLKDYYLVGASSWCPSDHAVLANLCGLSDDPIFVGISNQSDMQQYRMFAPWIEPVPILACDWVDPAVFNPLPHSNRTIDILMVAHWAYWKRHWLLFEALKHMRPDLNVVLIGREVQRGTADILAEAEAFGVRQRLTVLQNLEVEEVARHQCNARISLALSKREGSCVAVTEALFANTPVGIMEDAHIGAKAYINAQTGRILTPGRMSHTLEEMLETSGEYSARSWAENHISAQSSSDKLNCLLKQQSLRSGRPWTTDITPMCWRYVPSYLDRQDKERMMPGREKLRKEYGIELKDFISEKHDK